MLPCNQAPWSPQERGAVGEKNYTLSQIQNCNHCKSFFSVAFFTGFEALMPVNGNFTCSSGKTHNTRMKVSNLFTARGKAGQHGGRRRQSRDRKP